MMTQTSVRTPLSLQLKHETAYKHEAMHLLMEQGRPFSSRVQYARFVAAQYIFQCDVEKLFDDPAIRKAVPDLEMRGRALASRVDLNDLHAEIPEHPPCPGITMPAALGWLYVSEGSTLGAAFLLKEAQEKLGLSADFGARNLAAYPEGRALVWRRFVCYLDDTDLDDNARAEVVAGAAAAYDRFGGLLRRFFQMEQTSA